MINVGHEEGGEKTSERMREFSRDFDLFPFRP